MYENIPMRDNLPESPQADGFRTMFFSSTGKTEQNHIIKQLKLPNEIDAKFTDLLASKQLDEDLLQSENLLDDEEENVLKDKTDDQIDTLLLYASYKGYSEAVGKLMKRARLTSHTQLCSGLNALQLAIFNGHSICVENILHESKNRRLWLDTLYKGYTILQLAVFAKNVASVNAVLCYMQSECNVDQLKMQLDKKSTYSPYYTALHIAALQDMPVTAKWLLQNGAETEVVLDETKHTPLHLAALFKNTQTAKVLVECGASLRATTNQGLTALSLIANKVPRVLESINPMLDSLISVNEDTDRNKILCVDFSKLQTSAKDFRMNLLSCFVTSNQHKFLQHPVCQILLDENWDRVRMWFFARLFMCAVLLLCVTVYIVAFHASGCIKPPNRHNYTAIKCNGSALLSYVDGHKESQIMLLFVYYMVVPLTIFDIIRKMAGFFSFAKSPSTPNIVRTLFRYVQQFDNYFEWFCLITTLCLFYIESTENSWHLKLAPLVILISWANFMILLGQIPWFGVYVEMYISVLKEFLKLLSAYVCLLIGYAISFFMIFKKEQPFSNPLKAIWKTLAMMTGEFEYNDLFESESSNEQNLDFLSSFAVQSIFITFLFTIAIVLMNLLVGIVVHDVNEIKKSALATKLKRKVELVEYLETTSENIKFILRTALELIKRVIFLSICRIWEGKKATCENLEPFIEFYPQPKDRDFENEAKCAALQIAQVNEEIKFLDSNSDTVDGKLSHNSTDNLESKLQRNNWKIKQLMIDLNVLLQENNEIAMKLKT